jgi:hypothetical protein
VELPEGVTFEQNVLRLPRAARIGVTGKVWDSDGHLVATGASRLRRGPAHP